MSRTHTSQYAPAADPYAAHRCVNCKHLRYRDENPGDPCRFCPCTDHIVPGEVATDAAPQDAA